jgi:hypothetical protein
MCACACAEFLVDHHHSADLNLFPSTRASDVILRKLNPIRGLERLSFCQFLSVFVALHSGPCFRVLGEWRSK